MESFISARKLTIEVIREAFVEAGHDTKDWTDDGFLVVTEAGECTLVSLQQKHRALILLQRWELNAAGRYLEALEYANLANESYVLGRVVFNADGWLTVDHAMLTHRGLDLRFVLSSYRHFINATTEMRSQLPPDLEPEEE